MPSGPMPEDFTSDWPTYEDPVRPGLIPAEDPYTEGLERLSDAKLNTLIRDAACILVDRRLKRQREA